MDCTITVTDIATGVTVETSIVRDYVAQAPAPFWTGLMQGLLDDLAAQIGDA